MAKLDRKDAELMAEVDAYAEEKAQGLKTKNTELLGEIREVKAKLSKANEHSEELQAQLDKVEADAAKGKGDVQSQIDQALKPLNKKLEQITAERDGATARLNKLTKQRVLDDALTKAKISPSMQAAVRALIDTDHQVVVADKDGQATVTIDGKAPDDFVKEWVGTETGKNFVAASGNRGGAAPGANTDTKGGGKTWTRTEFNAADQATRAARAKDGFKVVDD